MALPYLSISQLSVLTGKDRATVKKKLMNVKPYSEKANATLYDGREALKYLVEPIVEDEKATSKKLLEEQLRYESARAEKVEIEVARQKGELVAIEDVTRTVGKEYTYVRASILSLPAKLARPIAIEDDPAVCMSLLKKEVDEILNHLQADVSLNIEPEEVDEKYFTEEEQN